MATSILHQVQILKEQSLAALFSMKDEEDMSERGREFFRLRREQELVRFKKSMEKESQAALSNVGMGASVA